MKCVLCGNNALKNISNQDAKSSEYLLVSMCDGCGLIQQNPIPTADALKIYYSHNYRKDYKKQYTPKPQHIYRAGKTALQRIHFLKNANISEGVLLDIGAGGGEFIHLAEKFGFQSTGVEPNIGYSEHAKNEYGCKVTTGEIDDIAGTYDIITMFHVLEHLPSPVKAFEKLHTLLKTNGTLLIEVPWIETNDASPNNIYCKAHIFYFSADTLIACASRFFDVTKVDTSSNLKILFEAKANPTSLKLPGMESVDRLKIRLHKKGWSEYLFKGKGLVKPIKKITRFIDESKTKGIDPKAILDLLCTPAAPGRHHSGGRLRKTGHPMNTKPSQAWTLDLGARVLSPTTVHFKVWAPKAEAVSVNVDDSAPSGHPLSPTQQGYWEGTVSGASANSRYAYVLNHDLERPDPASRFQPDGVHGHSMVIDPGAFPWTDHAWTGIPLERLMIYELHVGTFTPEGTFDAVIGKLPWLRDTIGVTALELMPVAQCPGVRNWGYDGACLFAPQANYGGPDGLKRLVDACHAHGLAVILDVVYNHLGPEGNYLGDYGPYFTHRYATPWGQAINYDGPGSDPVRQYIISNAVYWVTEFHMDALRLDAIHGIFDFSAAHIVRDLGEAVREQAAQCGRAMHVIAESDLNDARTITPVARGGHGLASQWSDDFHHALHSVLTGERDGYYTDFGSLDHLATAITDRFVYAGRYSAHRNRRHGNSAGDAAPAQFVVYAQNHDQVGNRAHGDRLSTLVPFEALKLAAAAVLLSPNLPLIFMGEEYGETAPFLYFIDHGDPALADAVRRGRRDEFASFGWHDAPDPQALSTYTRSRLQWDGPDTPERKFLPTWYRTLIQCRKSVPALGTGHPTDRLDVRTDPNARALTIHRASRSGPEAFIVLNFNGNATSLSLSHPEGHWDLRLDSDSPTFGGTHTLPAPPHLTWPHDTGPLRLPPHAAWVYTGGSAPGVAEGGMRRDEHRVAR